MKFMNFIFTLSVVGLLTIAGCSSSGGASQSNGNVSFTIIATGTNLDTGLIDVVAVGDDKITEVFEDQASLDAAAAEYNIDISNSEIDFLSEQVVLISMGIQFSGGYSISTTDALDAGDTVRLQVSLFSPGDNCIVTSALTHPFQLLKVESLKAITVEESNIVDDCL